MNGRKARARRRAHDRSRTNQGRLARKAARVKVDEREVAANEKLGAARRELDALLTSANEAFRKGVKALEQTRAEDRKRAYDDYEKQRVKILKDFAAEQQAA